MKTFLLILLGGALVVVTALAVKLGWMDEAIKFIGGLF